MANEVRRPATLDELLAQIENQAAVQEAQQQTADQSVIQALLASAHAEVRETPHYTNQNGVSLWMQDGLSAKQRGLPRLPKSMFMAMALVMMLAVGIGSSTFLTQNSQDVRQQAYDGRLSVKPSPLPSPTVERAPSEAVAESPAAIAPAWRWRVWLGGLCIALAILGLLGLFIGFFVV